jgi:16S rRNA processing protein RimM
MDKVDIAVGKVVGTYGNRGMVKVLPLTDFLDRFFNMDKITLELNGKKKIYTVAEVRSHRRHILFRLGEVPDMNGAEALRGAMVVVGREELTPLPEGSYYIFDIVGLNVFNGGGDFLGVVEDVIRTGSNDVYAVDVGQKAPLLVPALKEVVREVDIKGGRMVVDWPPGGDEPRAKAASCVIDTAGS